MDFAKVLRNSALSKKNRELIGRDLAAYLATEDPFFDRKTFMSVMMGDLSYDPKTEPYSTLKDL